MPAIQICISLCGVQLEDTCCRSNIHSFFNFSWLPHFILLLLTLSLMFHMKSGKWNPYT